MYLDRHVIGVVMKVNFHVASSYSFNIVSYIVFLLIYLLHTVQYVKLARII